MNSKLLAILEKHHANIPLSDEQTFLVTLLGFIVGRLRRVGLSSDQIKAQVEIAQLGIDDPEIGREGFAAYVDSIEENFARK